MAILLSASGGRMSTRALECLCSATDAEGFSSSLRKLHLRTIILLLVQRRRILLKCDFKTENTNPRIIPKIQWYEYFKTRKRLFKQTPKTFQTTPPSSLIVYLSRVLRILTYWLEPVVAPTIAVFWSTASKNWGLCLYVIDTDSIKGSQFLIITARISYQFLVAQCQQVTCLI